MKIRRGYVSNSSSSSFILAHSKDARIIDLIELLGVKRDYPLYPTCREISRFLYRAKEYTLEDLLDDYCYESWEEYENSEEYSSELEFAKKATDRGLIVKSGFASDEGIGAEGIVYQLEINYDSDNFMIFSEGRD